MERTVRRADPEIGYTWFESEGEYYVRNADGDLRRVSDDAFRLLSELADGEVSVDDLPENARDIVDTLREEGYLREDDPVVEIVPPEDVTLWPRVLAFLLLFGVGVVAAFRELPTVVPVDGLFTPTSAAAFVALLVVSVVVHESGHYLVASRHCNPTLRFGTVNRVIPAAITNTTDAWMLPRNRRLWITIAGPFAHLLWVSGLVGVHYLLFPENVLLSVLIVSNVAYVASALNPLIHGDGYWLVLDAFDIVDLRTRGIADLRDRTLSPAAAYVVVSYGFAGVLVAFVVAAVAATLGIRIGL
mgnify:CR=1 FL=1